MRESSLRSSIEKTSSSGSGILPLSESVKTVLRQKYRKTKALRPFKETRFN
jgi:hypothetical protein